MPSRTDLPRGLPKVVGIQTVAPPIFQHPVARDLAWMILNPSLLKPGKYNCPAKFHRHGDFVYDFYVPSSAWQVRAWEAFAPVLTQGSGIDKSLDALLAEKRKQRLGLYFERLMTFWFTHSPIHEIVAKGLAIRQTHTKNLHVAQPHKQKKQQHKTSTLGECDYLIFDKTTASLQHWEVAVKFYLGIQSPSDLQNLIWLGPNLKDRLDLKVHHTLNHQLPLSATAAAKSALEIYLENSDSRPRLSCSAYRATTQNLKPNSSYTNTANKPDNITRVLWIKGALYQNFDGLDTATVPKTISPSSNIAEISPALTINPLIQKGCWYQTDQRKASASIEYNKQPPHTLKRTSSRFDMGLPRLCWLGHRDGAEIIAQSMHNDCVLGRAAPAVQVGHNGPSAEHRASFCSQGSMQERFFQVTSTWLNAAEAHLNFPPSSPKL